MDREKVCTEEAGKERLRKWVRSCVYSWQVNGSFCAYLVLFHGMLGEEDKPACFVTGQCVEILGLTKAWGEL